jgi:hypothetical protein
MDSTYKRYYNYNVDYGLIPNEETNKWGAGEGARKHKKKELELCFVNLDKFKSVMNMIVYSLIYNISWQS